MLGDVWKTLLEYLKRTPYWPVLEPVLLVGFLYVGVCVVAYQYVQWRYQVTLDLPLFLQSYLFRQASVGFIAVVGSFIALAAGRAAPAPAAVTAPGAAGEAPGARPPARRWLPGRGMVARVVLVLLVGGVALYLLQRWAPESKISPIRVRFSAFGAFGTPAGDAAARDRAADAHLRLRDVAQYLLYEINHRQRAWQLEFETGVFRADLVTRADEERCAQDDTPPLCIAEAFRRGMLAGQPSYPPLVLVTAEPLGGGGTRAWFWLNRGPVSVVTTSDWGGPGSAGVVEFLAYALVVQSLMIHMQTYCGLTQPPAGGPEGVVIGNVFDLQPGYNAMRAAVLTGHLSRDDEKRLLNCFGPDYMRTATSLLSLGWLRSAPVSRNLLDVYGVKLLGA
jgi:hypothetical protein